MESVDSSSPAEAGEDTPLQLPPAELPLPFIPIGHPDSMMSKESVRRAVEDFRVRPTDVIVATFPKTGTTLVTWICHLLRVWATSTTSSMDSILQQFDTLYEVVPWPTLSWDIGYDPNLAGSQFHPRVFKSHLRMASIYRGCKYIVTIRDPAKTALSFYNFFRAKQVPFALEMDVSTFVMETPFIKGSEGQRASLWEYYQEYHWLMDCPAVLVLVYEDLVQHMPACIEMMAQFMDLPVSEQLVSRVSQASTKEFMAQHMHKFDEPYERAKQLGRAGDLSQLAPGAKIALQEHPQTLNDAAQDFLKQQWDKMLGLKATSLFGYPDYAAFANVFRQANQRRFNIKY